MAMVLQAQTALPLIKNVFTGSVPSWKPLQTPPNPFIAAPISPLRIIREAQALAAEKQIPLEVRLAN